MMEIAHKQGYPFEGTSLNYNQFRIINKRNDTPSIEMRSRLNKLL